MKSLRIFPVHVQINAGHHEESAPNVLSREGLCEEQEGEDDGESFATGGDGDGDQSAEVFYQSQHEINAHISGEWEEQRVAVGFRRMIGAKCQCLEQIALYQESQEQIHAANGVRVQDHLGAGRAVGFHSFLLNVADDGVGAEGEWDENDAGGLEVRVEAHVGQREKDQTDRH